MRPLNHEQMLKLLADWAPSHKPQKNGETPPGIRTSQDQDSCMTCAFMLMDRGGFAPDGMCSRFRARVRPTMICDDYEG